MRFNRNCYKNNINLINQNKKIALIGNPNVGKSTIFNALTGLNQHTGNWTGKTVKSAYGIYEYNNNKYTLVDLPGTYSLFSSSKEEEVSRNFICFEKHDLTVIILDGTMLERNLNLATQIIETGDNVIVCINLMDEAKKKNIYIDLKKLSEILKVPVIGTNANNKNDLKKLQKLIEYACDNKSTNQNIMKYNDKIEDVIRKMNMVLNKFHKGNNRFFSAKIIEMNKAFNNEIFKYLNLTKENIIEINNVSNYCNKYLSSNKIQDYQNEIISEIIENNNKISNMIIDQKRHVNSMLDKILTSKIAGIPIMIAFLGIILWLTITGANYPSKVLSNTLFKFNDYVKIFLTSINTPTIINNLITDGILKTLIWVVSVMLPPMAIFFPLFTLLEDCGFLPRIAFNLDKLFNKAKCHGKQALTMCMGFGCNACGVIGCRIIDSPRERIIAILTNNFVPCNGRFPGLIAIITMFFVGSTFSSLKSSFILTGAIVISIIVTLFISKILSNTILKGIPSSFVLEIPPYRKPQIGKVIIRSIFDRTLFVLGRAVSIAAPAGLVIWLLANINISGNNILFYCTNFLDPIANMFGIDGTILMAFILGFPANEIVIPIMLMSYIGKGSLVEYSSLFELKKLLLANGWTSVTAICTLVLILFHFPCSTTLITIKKETKNKLWTLLSFILPTIVGLIICFIINFIFKII